MSSETSSFKELTLNQAGPCGRANVLINLQMRTTLQIWRIRTILNKSSERGLFLLKPQHSCRRKAHRCETAFSRRLFALTAYLSPLEKWQERSGEENRLVLAFLVYWYRWVLRGSLTCKAISNLWEWNVTFADTLNWLIGGTISQLEWFRHRTVFKSGYWEFPGGPVVRDPPFHCRGHRFDPWLGN